MTIHIEPFYDSRTSTWSYVVHATDAPQAVVIDPVLDFDSKSGRVWTESVERLSGYLQSKGLRLDWVLETHAHADHLSAAHWLRERFGARIGIGAEICRVQKVFAGIFNLGPGFATDGRPFDALFHDGQVLEAGPLRIEVLHVPGHTPADVAYRVEDAVFVGDTLFMPDVGTARADFPGGDVHMLYRSIRRLLSLPGETRLFLCHDYPPGERAPCGVTTVAAQRAHNIHVRDGIGEDEFVAMRSARDATLEMPALLLPSIQVNIRAGQLPEREPNGRRYLKLPLNAFGAPGWDG
ncbi:MBL fold metallo-hydrolase [Schlegelella aquatica]|uniref:MBL fold metallo-hydrolase n=1 Tax=Caldimonas aquatica TaxID=376175 RepID=UPI0037519374